MIFACLKDHLPQKSAQLAISLRNILFSPCPPTPNLGIDPSVRNVSQGQISYIEPSIELKMLFGFLRKNAANAKLLKAETSFASVDPVGTDWPTVAGFAHRHFTKKGELSGLLIRTVDPTTLNTSMDYPPLSILILCKLRESLAQFVFSLLTRIKSHVWITVILQRRLGVSCAAHATLGFQE